MPKGPPTPITPEHLGDPIPAIEVLRRDHRLELQFRFMAVALLIVTVLLAWRTEVQQANTREQAERLAWAAYDACGQRHDLAVQYNDSRVNLIDFWTERQRDQSQAAIQETRDRLSQGLLLPIEECGDAPSFPDPGLPS